MSEERKTAKCNAAIIKKLLWVKCEAFWMVPYDPRRNDPVVARLERCLYRAIVLFGRTELAEASREELASMRSVVAEIEECVRRLFHTGYFPQAECREALLRLERINAVLCAGGAGIPSR